MTRDRQIRAVAAQVQRLAARRDRKLREAQDIDAQRREAARRLEFLLATTEPLTVEIRWNR